MTTETGTGSEARQKAYRHRIGFVAESPNFPGDWNQIVEKVKIADELGFDSIWLAESWGYELFTSMADLVRVTKRIKIGAGIANIYSRTPAVLATTAATLDQRSGGRIILGLGTSGANVIEHWHGIKFEKPLQRTREYVEIIRMILHREKLIHQGEFFNLERGFKLRFTPLRADLPLYIAAIGPKNVVQTGEIADGVLPVYWPEHRWGKLRAMLDEGASKAGRPAHSAAIAPFITSMILSEHATEEEIQAARVQVATPLAYYITRMGVYYAQALTRHGFGDEVQTVIEAGKAGIKSAVQAVSPAMLDAISIVGKPQQIVDKLDHWAALGVDEPLLSMPGGTVDEAAARLSALMTALKA